MAIRKTPINIPLGIDNYPINDILLEIIITLSTEYQKKCITSRLNEKRKPDAGVKIEIEEWEVKIKVKIEIARSNYYKIINKMEVNWTLCATHPILSA